MKLSPQTFNRRNFLSRSSMWFAALGLAPQVRMDLVEKVAKKMGIHSSELYASELSSNKAQFCIELCFRAGFPFASMICPSVDRNMGRVAMCSTENTPAGRLARRAAAHLPSDVLEISGSGSANLYLSPFASALNPLIQDGTIGVAGCQAIQTNGGHQPNFATRMVAPNSGNQMVANGAPCPGIHFASVMPQNTILRGVEWKANDNATFNNAPNGFQALTRIGGGTGQSMVNGTPLSQQAQNFLNLFSPAALPFSIEEAQVIAQATERLNQNYITYRSIKDSDQVIATASLGSDLLTQDFRSALIPSMGTYTDWNMAQARASIRIAEALYMLTMAFSMGLIRSATLTVDTSDWHGRLGGVDLSSLGYNPESTSHAMEVRYVTNALAKTYTLAKTLSNPLAPGKTVADGLVVMMTSEFSRTWTHDNCNDHGDGGTNFIGIIGPTAKNITASNWDHNTGQTVSIDRVTGDLNVNAPLFSTGSAYATLCSSLGIPAGDIGRYTSDPAILAMLKS